MLVRYINVNVKYYQEKGACVPEHDCFQTSSLPELKKKKKEEVILIFLTDEDVLQHIQMLKSAEVRI